MLLLFTGNLSLVQMINCALEAVNFRAINSLRPSESAESHKQLILSDVLVCSALGLYLDNGMLVYVCVCVCVRERVVCEIYLISVFVHTQVHTLVLHMCVLACFVCVCRR